MPSLPRSTAEAKQFLGKKAELEQKLELLNQQYTLSCENSMKMREMHDKLQKDIGELKSRREMLKVLYPVKSAGKTKKEVKALIKELIKKRNTDNTDFKKNSLHYLCPNNIQR